MDIPIYEIPVVIDRSNKNVHDRLFKTSTASRRFHVDQSGKDNQDRLDNILDSNYDHATQTFANWNDVLRAKPENVIDEIKYTEDRCCKVNLIKAIDSLESSFSQEKRKMAALSAPRIRRGYQRNPTAGLLTNASPELVFLASGMPNPDLFPFHQATVKLKDGSNIVLKDEIMTVALQYGPTNGYPPLLKHLKSLVQRLHHPPLPEGFEILVTPGSQDGLCKAIEMLIMPNDYFIIQDPCYSGTLAILKPYDPKFIPLECDSKGVIPESLKIALSKWNAHEIRKKVEDVPKVIYINPNAANPSGVSQPAERRREIYGLASEFDLIILEDDPYYFVQFDDIESFPPSYLSLDKDGRVLRFDSFSKVLSSGVRLGFVSGPKTLIDRIMLHMQASVLHASSLSQVLVSSLFDKWGEDGFLSHTKKVQQFYRERRDVMLQAAQRHLSGLCEWSVPTGGMFLWMKIHGVVDTWDMVMKRGLEKNVILVPGRAFSCDSNAPSPFLRAAFSLATPEQMERGMKSLAMLIQEEVMIQSSEK